VPSGDPPDGTGEAFSLQADTVSPRAPRSAQPFRHFFICVYPGPSVVNQIFYCMDFAACASKPFLSGAIHA
jgi:hypothetical protein